jgi:hypothetical protein
VSAGWKPMHRVRQACQPPDLYRVISEGPRRGELETALYWIAREHPVVFEQSMVYVQRIRDRRAAKAADGAR